MSSFTVRTRTLRPTCAAVARALTRFMLLGVELRPLSCMHALAQRTTCQCMQSCAAPLLRAIAPTAGVLHKGPKRASKARSSSWKQHEV